MTDRLEISHYRGYEGLRCIERGWREVTDRMTDRTFHHLYEWHLSCAESLAHDTPSHYLVVRRDGVPVGICPLRCTRQHLLGVPGVVLDQADVDLNSDFIFDKRPANRRLVHRVVEYLRSPAGIAHDAIVLRRVREDACALYAVIHAPPGGTLIRFADCAAAIPCDRPFAEVRRRTSASLRAHLRQSQRRLATLPDLRFTLTRSAEDLPHAMRVFQEVEASGWKGPAGESSAVKLDEHVRPVYEAAMRHFGAHGACEIDQLWTGKDCIAAQYSLATDDTLATLKTGYDERFARFSPGLALFAHTVERCCTAPEIRRVNLISDPAWANSWRPARTNVFDLFIFNRTPRGLLLRTGFQLTRGVGRFLGRTHGDLTGRS